MRMCSVGWLGADVRGDRAPCPGTVLDDDCAEGIAPLRREHMRSSMSGLPRARVPPDAHGFLRPAGAWASAGPYPAAANIQQKCETVHVRKISSDFRVTPAVRVVFRRPRPKPHSAAMPKSLAYFARRRRGGACPRPSESCTSRGRASSGDQFSTPELGRIGSSFDPPARHVNVVYEAVERRMSRLWTSTHVGGALPLLPVAPP